MTFKKPICVIILLTILSTAVQGKYFRKKSHNRASDSLVLKIEDGSILGRQSQTIRDNMTYYAFEGIPYAKPPIGNLRFQPPVPNDKWDGTLNATAWKDICLQDDNNTKSSEDCLYINVYTPSLTKKQLPVMVWVYGGGLYFGSGNIVPDYLLEQKDIILVSFNYRLGLLGFISTDDLVLPGNAGLKDQVLALKWVQRNIAHFGGNPQNVTIFGESSGGASVSYLQQSKLTKGLFQGAIMQSGSSLSLWSLTKRARQLAFLIGNSLGIFTSNSTELLNELLKVDGKQLIDKGNNAIFASAVTTFLEGLAIGAVKEPEHEGAFFTGLSHQLFSQGNYHQVPTIVGHNSQEVLPTDYDPDVLRVYLIRYNLISANLVPIDMNISNNTKKWEAGDKIKQHYFGSLPIYSEMKNAAQFLSDDQFNRPTTELVRLLSKNAPTYFYVFSYKGQLGSGNRSEPGVGHGEELPYLLSPSTNDPTPFDIVVSNRLCRLWTNFAKYGNPTPERSAFLDNVIWQPSNSKDLKYLDIDSKLTLKLYPNKENLDFYQNLYHEYGNPPYDTY